MESCLCQGPASTPRRALGARGGGRGVRCKLLAEVRQAWDLVGAPPLDLMAVFMWGVAQPPYFSGARNSKLLGKRGRGLVGPCVSRGKCTVP